MWTRRVESSTLNWMLNVSFSEVWGAWCMMWWIEGGELHRAVICDEINSMLHLETSLMRCKICKMRVCRGSRRLVVDSQSLSWLGSDCENEMTQQRRHEPHEIHSFHFFFVKKLYFNSNDKKFDIICLTKFSFSLAHTLEKFPCLSPSSHKKEIKFPTTLIYEIGNFFYDDFHEGIS